MSQMNRRRALQLLAALGTTGFAAGCGSDTDDQPSSDRGPIKIGLIAPQGGGFKSIGDDITNGFQLYLDLHEQRLGGHSVTVLTADEGETAETGKAAVDGLLKQGVLALTGVVNSAVMVGIRDTIEQARVPLIGSNASPSSLQSVVYIWRTSYVLDEAGRALGPVPARPAPAQRPGGDHRAGERRQPRTWCAASGRSSAPPTRGSPTPWSTPPPSPTPARRRTSPTFAGHWPSGPPRSSASTRERPGSSSSSSCATSTPGRSTPPASSPRARALESLTRRTRCGIQTASNYSADLNNTANRVFASAYRKKHQISPSTYAMASYDAAQVLDQAIRLDRRDRRPRSRSTWRSARSARSTARAASGSSTSRAPRSRSGTCARSSATVRCMSNVLINELATLG